MSSTDGTLLEDANGAVKLRHLHQRRGRGGEVFMEEEGAASERTAKSGEDSCSVYGEINLEEDALSQVSSVPDPPNPDSMSAGEALTLEDTIKMKTEDVKSGEDSLIVHVGETDDLDYDIVSDATSTSRGSASMRRHRRHSQGKRKSTATATTATTSATTTTSSSGAAVDAVGGGSAGSAVNLDVSRSSRRSGAAGGTGAGAVDGSGGSSQQKRSSTINATAVGGGGGGGSAFSTAEDKNIKNKDEKRFVVLSLVAAHCSITVASAAASARSVLYLYRS